MKDRPIYIASCSFGKDSMATILLAYLHNEPLDRIFSVEVMFDNANGISGEVPEHIQWVHNFAIPYLRVLFGNRVQIDIVKSKTDYVRAFTRKLTKSKAHPERVGRALGFPMVGMCVINRDCKVATIKEYNKQFNQQLIQYIGIAADESERLKRLDGDKISLLQKYGYTEKDAWDLCKRFGLLSPIYKISSRGGCWFCPNAKRSEQLYLRKNHPEIWARLEELNATHKHEMISKTFTIDKTFEQICKEMDFLDRQTKLDFGSYE